MTDQQKKAVEEAAIKEHKFNHIKVNEVSFRLGFEVGAEEVLDNPEKYGLGTWPVLADKLEILTEENARLRSALKQIAEDKKEEYLNATDDVRLKAISILAKGALKGGDL